MLYLARIRATAWHEYVDTKANIADGGSRVGKTCPLAKKVGISLANYILPQWPEKVMKASAQEWLDWFDGS